MLVKNILTKIAFLYIIFGSSSNSIAADKDSKDLQFKVDNAIQEIYKRKNTIKANTERLEEFLASDNFQNIYPDTNPVINISPYIEDALIPLQAFGDQPELILAFSPHNYHTFIVAGDFEFHGVIYPGKGFYRNVRDHAIRSGFFVRFPQQSIENIIRTKDYIKLMHQHKSELCLHAALEILARGADININKRKVRTLSGLAKAILKKGFVDSQGHKVPIQIFRAYHKSTKTILKEINKIEALFYIPGFFGYYGAKLGRMKKNRSTRYLEQHGFYQHPQFPPRNPK